MNQYEDILDTEDIQNTDDINTHDSDSKRLRLQILMAVCLTMAPKVLRLTTIPSTRGIAIDILQEKICPKRLCKKLCRIKDSNHQQRNKFKNMQISSFI